ncbi:MAG: hypothetical protein ABW161_19445, partial [Candidatus Thiodiazotropha sp.]
GAFGAGIILFLVPAFSSCQYRQMDEISGLMPKPAAHPSTPVNGQPEIMNWIRRSVIPDFPPVACVGFP